jgi:hypothetical protein
LLELVERALRVARERTDPELHRLAWRVVFAVEPVLQQPLEADTRQLRIRTKK